jgi:integrase
MKFDKFFDKRENVWKHRARFQLNGIEYKPTAYTRAKLNEIVDEIRGMSRRQKYNLQVPDYSPTLAELFAKHETKIKAEKQKILFKRVSEKFLKLFPEGLRLLDLNRAHFQDYIDFRTSEKNTQTKEDILPETANKELYCLSTCLKAAPLYFHELKNYQPIQIPKAKESNRRRERIVDPDNELMVLLEELRKSNSWKAVERARHDLADDLEIRYETGLRRKEVSWLEPDQYKPDEGALRNVKRWKTDTVTKFFPLSRRAIEIIEKRLKDNPDAKFIFSPAGKPKEGAYKTLRVVCRDLGITYGANVKNGFVPHDLRHNFATDIIRLTDIETAKSLTGHSGNAILTYLHTDEQKQREAIRKREGIDFNELVTDLYNGIKNDKIGLKEFAEKIRFLTRF